MRQDTMDSVGRAGWEGAQSKDGERRAQGGVCRRGNAACRSHCIAGTAPGWMQPVVKNLLTGSFRPDAVFHAGPAKDSFAQRKRTFDAPG